MTAPPPSARRLTVPAARIRRWLDGFIDRHGDGGVVLETDRLVLRGQDDSVAWLQIPFPPFASTASTTTEVLDDFAGHVERDRRVAALLVRRGGHAVGVFQGDHLTSSKVGSRYVQGTTKAGGWSQQRFANRRANQSRAAFEKAADDAVTYLLPAVGKLDALVTGGDRPAIDTVLADVRLQNLAALRLEPNLSVPDPRQAVLVAMPEQFRAVRIAISP